LAGKMAGELGFIDGDVLDPDGALACLEIDHAVDQQHRIAMRDHFHDAKDVDRSDAHSRLALTHCPRPSSAPAAARWRPGENIPSPWSRECRSNSLPPECRSSR